MKTWTLWLSLALASGAPAALADATAAAGCDANGMRIYQMGFLTRGEKWTPEVSDATRELQQAHLANIRRLADEGSLLIAGPFVHDDSDDDQSLRGIFIFDVPTREDALRLSQSDPAVQAGRLAIRIVPWYGPCGLTYAAREDGGR